MYMYIYSLGRMACQMARPEGRMAWWLDGWMAHPLARPLVLSYGCWQECHYHFSNGCRSAPCPLIFMAHLELHLEYYRQTGLLRT